MTDAGHHAEQALEEMPSGRTRFSILKKVGGYLLGALILLFLGLYLYRSWQEVPEGAVRVDWLYFCVSAALTFVFFFMQAVGWKFIVSGLGPDVSLLKCLKIWFYSQVAKYVPGKVMLPLLRAGYCAKEGTKVSATFLSILVECTIMMITGSGIFIASTIATIEQVTLAKVIPYLLLIPAGLVGIHPRIMGPVVNFGLKLIKREPIDITLSYGAMIKLLLLFLGGWIIYGIGGHFLCLAFTDLEPIKVIPVIGIFALGWVAGFASVITPGGLGVREGAIAVLLATFMPKPLAILISIVSRLVWTGAEVAGAAALSRVKIGE